MFKMLNFQQPANILAWKLRALLAIRGSLSAKASIKDTHKSDQFSLAITSDGGTRQRRWRALYLVFASCVISISRAIEWNSPWN